ncbi:ATPase, T2SS/T4P/T4SS family [Vibrio sp. TH_r3]|uniref:GspE/PulE family protein n=1 Tax=Vibrio sp. TH_r3 TaxID=3082084 RepID=UPI002953D5FD|nr:ATPase, T2SS/T4P/T4SS family [Vibrio sp. TH_r3]MDV7104462.1 ATPase, T2SS/T4P/T4SS family [Vibrio sp. TH_r3]
MQILNTISNQQLSEMVTLSDEERITTTTHSQNSDPISRYLNQVLTHAINKNASDIHFEPYEKTYRIRLRCDGVLSEIQSPDLQLANRLSSKVKVLANLDIAEKRLPQDGRFKFTLISNQTVDIRVSTLPTLWGEKVVLRLLETQTIPLEIDKLGFISAQQDLFLSAIHKPQGLILITGPTGSGKTVSLYTALNIVNTPDKNISTVEDPVEINLLGINQVQINEKIELNFVATLKALLRQDPDIIMVGEIRDIESTQIVIKAAQTGHLVLATLHTNSACETLTRLINMGADKHCLASCLSIIVAQRLIRKLCPICKEIDNDSTLALSNELQPSNVIYQANNSGCPECINGYSGRTALYEILNVNRTIIEAIESEASAFNIEKSASEQQFISIKEAGKIKLLQGITSIDELHRVLIY